MKICHSATIVRLFLSFALFQAATYAQKASLAWSYQGSDGPNDWGKLDPASVGHTQSPVDIKGTKKSDLPALRLDYKTVPLNIIDNGRSIQVNYAPGSTLTVSDKTGEL